MRLKTVRAPELALPGFIYVRGEDAAWHRLAIGVRGHVRIPTGCSIDPANLIADWRAEAPDDVPHHSCFPG